MSCPCTVAAGWQGTATVPLRAFVPFPLPGRIYTDLATLSLSTSPPLSHDLQTLTAPPTSLSTHPLTHTHTAFSLGGHGLDLHDSSVAEGLKPGSDNGTYEATLFGDRAVDLITVRQF